MHLESSIASNVRLRLKAFLEDRPVT